MKTQSLTSVVGCWFVRAVRQVALSARGCLLPAIECAAHSLFRCTVHRVEQCTCLFVPAVLALRFEVVDLGFHLVDKGQELAVARL